MIRISYFSSNKVPVGTRLKNEAGKDIGIVHASTPLDARFSRMEVHVREDISLSKIYPDLDDSMGTRPLRVSKNE